MQDKAQVYLEKLMERYPILEACKEQIRQTAAMLYECYKAGNKVMVCGNGGSAADAEHICGELMKGFLKKRPLGRELKQKLEEIEKDKGSYIGEHLQQGLPAIPLYNIGLFTAFINDVKADLVYAQQVAGLGKPGDVLWGISTSGNAGNVLYALITAKALGMKTIGLSGQTGGLMAKYCDVIIKVPSMFTPEIQEYHLPVYHCLCQMIEAMFFEQ